MVLLVAADALLPAALALAVALPACSSSESPAHEAQDATLPGAGDGARHDAAQRGVTPPPEGHAPWPTLADWHLFVDADKQAPADRVVPYAVNSQLFADYAAKHRFVYVPESKKIGYHPTDKWDFPVGTILVKTFSYLADARDPTKGERLLETRLLVRESAGWAPHTYVWDVAQTTATLEVAGDTIDAEFIDPSGNSRQNAYVVPNENDCRGCHGKVGVTNTLGGRTRQLERDNDYGSGPENQIDHFTNLGLFDVAPEPAADRERLVDPFGTADVFERVRSYVDGNCAHCHEPGAAQGSTSRLWLDYASTDPTKNPAVNWGVCKEPTSAGIGKCGLVYDVVPGASDQSIIVCRVGSSSTRGAEKMPPLGRNLVHTEAVALLREWIDGLSGGCQPAGPPARDAGGGDSGGRDASARGGSVVDASGGGGG